MVRCGSDRSRRHRAVENRVGPECVNNPGYGKHVLVRLAAEGLPLLAVGKETLDQV